MHDNHPRRQAAGNLTWFCRARYRPHAQMKSGAQARHSSYKRFSELFEIAAVAHRHDNPSRRYNQPTSVLPLDLFDRTEAGQGRAGYNLINVAMTLHVDVTVPRFANRPVRQDRQAWRLRFVGGGFRPWRWKRRGS